MPDPSLRVLYVCLGNICRSPMAAAILRRRTAERGWAWTIASAGTGPWHAGEDADPRTRAACAAHGTEIQHVARQVESADAARFDLVLGMDRDNVREVTRLLAPALSALPRHAHPEIRLVGADDPEQPGSEVADPYHDGPAAFTAIYAQLDRCALGLIARAGKRAGPSA